MKKAFSAQMCSLDVEEKRFGNLYNAERTKITFLLIFVSIVI